MAEYIERTEELILAMNAGARAIENTKRYHGVVYTKDVFSGNPQEIPYLQAAKVLREVSDAPAADVAPVVWIPVTDRLPEVGTRSNGWGDVTVIATNGKFVLPLIYERAIVRGKVVWRWKWLWDRIYDGKPVTHWMTLPEPPKGV